MKNRRNNSDHKKIGLIILLLVSFIAVLFLSNTGYIKANSIKQEGPERKVTITVSYTTYEWWLLTWNNSQLVCQVYAEHEGWPDPSEVEYYCGKQVLKDWLGTSSCFFTDEITGIEQCPGLYLHLANVTPGEREIEVDLMPPSVYVDITDCDPTPPENRCNALPSLHLIGKEPLPNEQIINIQGYIGKEAFTCEGNECAIPLPVTGIDGITATFWAESSYGDSSDTFTAQIRVIPWGDFAAPDDETKDNPQWYVDILSSQYLGDIQSSCSEIWSAFPPIGGPPAWLSSPEHPDGLISDQPYYYLAGSLIGNGLVDASTCQNNGLETLGVANQCGLEASRDVISTWQNQFNSEIIQVADQTGVPAQLMKNIFSRESQFWPGLSASYQEAGLGHLSDLGADMVLLWNPSFFSQFCPLVLDTTVCQQGFGNLDIADQEMLRGALVQKVNAACPDCPDGIDLSKANFSISIFARSLLASCEQVGQIIYNETGRTAGEVSFYEDLWKFTLVNYNAGPGCLTSAIQQTVKSNAPLIWDNVQLFLEPGSCQASIDYVNDIIYMPSPPIMETLDVQPTTQTPSTTETVTPTPQPTESIQITPTPTPTLEGYPTLEPTDSNPYPYPYP
jgi:hypothetical protein